ncbi:MAG TPA: MmgE/PrpD family protein [Burkholderiales bacterium]|nr:MmgE/PrpD family protein [Burkholderiales bacterium]
MQSSAAGARSESPTLETEPASAHPQRTLSEHAAQWMLGLSYEGLPADVMHATRSRVLDIIGLALAGAMRDPARSVYRASAELGSGHDSRLIYYGNVTSAPIAALVNGTMAHSLEFDDTHNETIVHVSVPLVTTALALGDKQDTGLHEIITAIAGAAELATRIAVIAPGQLNRHGYHPTGIVGTMSATYLASCLMGLSVDETRHAVGIAGSQAAGLMECWSDGTWSKFLHPGLSAQAAITAATLARAGFTGPATVFEGRFGLFRSHVQDPAFTLDFPRMLAGLGGEWESRNISFKPYPCGHVIHPFLDALFHLYREEGLRAENVKTILCPIADYMVPIVCEPVAEKLAPASDWQGRVSLQYSLAETLYRGRCDVHSYDEASLHDPGILDLARRVTYTIDKEAPGRRQFKGWVIVETRDGRRLERIQPHNWGSRKNPMTESDIENKFHTNAGDAFDVRRRNAVVEFMRRAENVAIRDLVSLCIR